MPMILMLMTPTPTPMTHDRPSMFVQGSLVDKPNEPKIREFSFLEESFFHELQKFAFEREP